MKLKKIKNIISSYVLNECPYCVEHPELDNDNRCSTCNLIWDGETLLLEIKDVLNKKEKEWYLKFKKNLGAGE